MRSNLLHTSSLARVLLTGFYLFWVASELCIRVSRPRPTGRETGRGTGPLLLGSFVASLVAASALASNDIGPQILPRSWSLFTIGLAVALAGVALRAWAVVTLGRFFQLVVVVQDGHTVVRSGPYRVVRHPSYAGALLTIVGVGIALGNWLGLMVCVVVPLAGLLPRIMAEERALSDGLGEDYRRYQRQTARLVPRIW